MDNHGNILIYQTEDGLTKIDVNMQDETVWLSQAEMTELSVLLSKTLVYIKITFLKMENLKELQMSRNTWQLVRTNA